MRDRSRTIDALRRLAERPGTPQEGETARRLLAQFGATEWTPREFDRSVFKEGTQVFYCYWCYRNYTGIICKQPPKIIQGKIWLQIKFDRLKPRWVPVTSDLGCHLGLTPFEGDEQETLYRMDLNWKDNDREYLEKLVSMGISVDDPQIRSRQKQSFINLAIDAILKA